MSPLRSIIHFLLPTSPGDGSSYSSWSFSPSNNRETWNENTVPQVGRACKVDRILDVSAGRSLSANRMQPPSAKREAIWGERTAFEPSHQSCLFSKCLQQDRQPREPGAAEREPGEWGSLPLGQISVSETAESSWGVTKLFFRKSLLTLTLQGRGLTPSTWL